MVGGRQKTTLFMGIGETRSEQSKETEKRGRGRKSKKKK